MSEPSDQQPPQIIYGVIIRALKIVLAEHTGLAGNFQQAIISILPKIDRTAEEWKSYTYGEYAFHYIIDAEADLLFLAMAEHSMGRRIPFAFLAAAQEAFNKRYSSDQVQSAIAYGMNGDFRGELQLLMDRFNSPDADRVAQLNAKVADINDKLMESIDRILERQEKIELLVNRSEVLSTSSVSFRREAEQVRRRMWWRNTRTLAMLSLAALVGILILLMSACGITFQRC